MKKLLLFALIITNFSSFSQTINEIVFEKKSHDNLKLNKIELLSDKTILYFTLTSSSENEWFNINQKSFLNDHTNKISYDLLKAENVEYSPKKTYFSKIGETKSFKLTYEKMRENCSSIDFVDCMESGCFWIAGINIPVNKSKKNIDQSDLETLKKLFQNNEFDKLLEFCLFLKKSRENTQEIDIYLGIAYAAKQNFPQAIKYFESYLEIEPENEFAISILAQSYVNIENYEKAIPYLSKSIDFNNVYSYYLRGIANFKLNKIDNSILDFEYYKKEEKEITDSSFYHWLGKAYLEKGAKSSKENKEHEVQYYYDKAITEFKNAISLTPNNYNYISSLGMAYMLSNELELADFYFKKSLEINPDQINIKNFQQNIKSHLNTNKIKLKKENGTFLIPATLNNSVTVEFIFDSGASEVLVSPEIVAILIKRNTISEKDILESGYYTIADGSVVKMARFKMKEIKIGEKVLKNVECSVANDLYTDMLLGQSVLSKFGKYTFDNNTQTLLIE